MNKIIAISFISFILGQSFPYHLDFKSRFFNFFFFNFLLCFKACFLSVGHALNCYVCTSTNVGGNGCGYPFTASGASQLCAAGETFCRTDVIFVDGSKTVVTRSCSSNCASTSNVFFGNGNSVSCCTGNLCNTSQQLKFSFVSSLIFVSIALSFLFQTIFSNSRVSI